ncbi:MAG: hypothetical protein NT154_32175 [Verrucomicrobia bacterium]|nr:hypothetical protein [Verrucomicrobiota bacterium]
MWGITDLQMLWQKKFKRGTAGTALKCVLGSKGRKPARPACDGVAPDLETCPVKELPLVPGTGRLDLDACLAKFGIQDPAVLWQRRFRPYSAGGRLKMCLRAHGFDPSSSNHGWRPGNPRAGELPMARSVEAAPAQPDGRGTSHPAGQGSAQGPPDIQAALEELGIGDPKSLWQHPIEPGSPQHELKKTIARALARREPVPGISRGDIGLSP